MGALLPALSASFMDLHQEAYERRARRKAAVNLDVEFQSPGTWTSLVSL